MCTMLVQSRMGCVQTTRSLPLELWLMVLGFIERCAFGRDTEHIEHTWQRGGKRKRMGSPYPFGAAAAAGAAELAEA